MRHGYALLLSIGLGMVALSTGMSGCGGVIEPSDEQSVAAEAKGGGSKPQPTAYVTVTASPNPVATGAPFTITFSGMLAGHAYNVLTGSSVDWLGAGDGTATYYMQSYHSGSFTWSVYDVSCCRSSVYVGSGTFRVVDPLPAPLPNSASCSVSPNPVGLASSFVVTAAGLPPNILVNAASDPLGFAYVPTTTSDAAGNASLTRTASTRGSGSVTVLGTSDGKTWYSYATCPITVQ